MNENVEKELDGIWTDLVSLEGALSTMKEYAFSADNCHIWPLVWVGNSLEIAIEFLSKRSEALEALLSENHRERLAGNAGSHGAGQEADHE